MSLRACQPKSNTLQNIRVTDVGIIKTRRIDKNYASPFVGRMGDNHMSD